VFIPLVQLPPKFLPQIIVFIPLYVLGAITTVVFTLSTYKKIDLICFETQTVVNYKHEQHLVIKELHTFWSQPNDNERDFNILVIFVTGHYLDNNILLMSQDRFFTDRLDQLAESQR